MTPISSKSYGIGSMIILSLLLCIYTRNQDPNCNHEPKVCEYQQEGWVMDTLYHSEDSSRMLVQLHYYQVIEYHIDTVEVIEEDGVRWYTIDTTSHIHKPKFN